MLASGSPRRLEILRTFGLDPVVCPSTFPETLSYADFDDPAQYAVATGSAKVIAVSQALGGRGVDVPRFPLSVRRRRSRSIRNSSGNRLKTRQISSLDVRTASIEGSRRGLTRPSFRSRHRRDPRRYKSCHPRKAGE